MTDIVSRLRAKRIRGRPGFYNPDELCQEAGNEIERLRAVASGLDKFALVIESAVRLADPANYHEVLAAIKANRAAIGVRHE